jgi:hypothetical protein
MGMPFVHVLPFQRSVLVPEVRAMTVGAAVGY